MKIVDLTTLPAAQRYEDRYQQYMDIFKEVAHTPSEIVVKVINSPKSWVPIFYHLNCEIDSTQNFFDHCSLVPDIPWFFFDRTSVEVLCGFRPECVDALWKCDMQWPLGRVRKYPTTKEFVVTNNGSFHRPEVLEFYKHLKRYKPTKKKVLLVPCAADKPYPSPLHQKCLEMLPDDYYLMNATGVVGLVPQDLWPVMPWYDSGIPNEWRLMNVVSHYFYSHHHSRVVVYCDFYSQAIMNGLYLSQQPLETVSFVLPVKAYDDYENLLDPTKLRALETALSI
jgi:hypothetical protein